ncbi:MAG: PIG-L family deacetylase [Chloroflexi bacterium]|nr:MAG: PIG-L family deacetylase [Chloroflexota bacterium]
MAAVLLITDRSIPLRDPRRFKNVLAVFPHADDETVHCGGSLARFAEAGARVTLLLLTGGERGNPEGTIDPALKAVRRRESEQAAAILGVARVIQEDLADGQLQRQTEAVASALSRRIAEVDPDLILSYDLAGFDGHEDHVVCSQALTELCRTQFPTVPLWYVALPARLLRLLVRVGQVADDSRVTQPRATPTHRLFIGSAIVPKIRAWSVYRSQRGSIGKGLGRLIPAWLPVSLLQFEYFADASPPHYPPPERKGQ